MQLTRGRARALVLLMTAVVWAAACDPAPSPPAAGRPAAPNVPSLQVAPEARSTVGFRSEQLLEEHFAKHGREFGSISPAEYLRRAQTLRDAPVGGDIREVVRSDGVVSRFDRASGAFIAFDANRTIRTFFRPNDGETYFLRQAKRRPQGR